MGSKEANKRYRQKTNTPEGRARRAEYARQWRLRHLDKSRSQALRYANAHKAEISARLKQNGQAIKGRVLKYYGNGKTACVQCGESRMGCLSIDHINNDGYKQRKETGNGINFYNWLRRNKFPTGYQTLCMNCQFLKKHWGL